MKSSNDKSGIKLGMWLFLYTEIMLFGGLFVLYAVYYAKYTEDFATGGKQLDTTLGALNTVVLLASSFAIAASLTAVQRKSKKTAYALVLATVGSAIVFLVNKYFEWGHKFELGIYPNSDKLLEGPVGENIFFGLYYVATGLHGLHVLIGMTLLTVTLGFMAKDKITADRFSLLENAALYWHLVDLIWIFIFPLFYLMM